MSMSATREVDPKGTKINISSISDLKEDYKELGIINQRQENRVNNLESKAYQLVAFYLIFQALIPLILVTISQAASQICINWWIPFTLFFLVHLLLAVSFIETVIKYSRTKWQLELNRFDRDMMKRKMDVAKMSPQGKAPVLCVEDQGLKPDDSKWRKPHIYIALTMITLFISSIFMIFACRYVLCDA